MNVCTEINAINGSHSFHLKTWSDNLAKAAQTWSENCTWGHGPSGAVTVQYGQNVWLDKAATTGNPVGITATRGWFEESRFYDHATNDCSGEQCGHYTQVGSWFDTRSGIF